MTMSIGLGNIAALGLQAALIVAAGAALARGLRMREPGPMLAYWRAILLVCLLLPLGQPWRSAAPPVITAAAWPGAPAGPSAVAGTRLPAPRPWPWLPRKVDGAILTLLAGGMAARALWLTMGAFALGRMRRRAVPLVPLPSAIHEAQARIGTRAAICVADGIAGPMTFGLVHPVILLPADVRQLAPHVQSAIACHELLHVRRRDWACGVLEEIVRTILWFHPAVWWLVGRIQLSREQVVDAAVIRLTGSRDHYIDALLTVALGASPAALTPAPRFLRRSHLKKRVTHILQETTMTRHRLIASLTASVAALGFAAILAVRSFPLEAQAPATASTGAPVEIVKGGDHLLHAALPEYPRRANEQQVGGDVLLDLAIDERGEVADARVLSGPDELRKAALESALEWHYSPAAVRSTSVQAVLRFNAAAGRAANAEFEGRRYSTALGGAAGAGEAVGLAYSVTEGDGRATAQRTERQIEELRKAFERPETPTEQRDELKAALAKAEQDLVKIRVREADGFVTLDATEPDRPLFGAPVRLAQIKTERVSEGSVSELLAQAGIRLGDTVTEDTAKRVREIAASIDEHWRVAFRGDGKGGVVLTIIAP